VPLVALGGWQPPAADNFIFPIGLPAGLQAQVLARFAFEPLKLTRIALIENDDDKRALPDRAQSQTLSSAFGRSFRQSGGTIVAELSFKNRNDLKGLVGSLEAKKPEAVLLAGVAEDLTALRAAGLDQKLPLLFAGPDGSAESQRTNPMASGVYFVTAFVSDATPQAQTFSSKYKDRFGELPDVHSALAYDGARLLCETIHQSKAVDGARLRQTLTETKSFESLTGPVSWEASKGAGRAGFVVRIEDGHVRMLKRFEPEATKKD
jgi:branched-chain amino acid transport system substrate-binding protein